MKINFYPDHNNKKFEKAAEEYSKIWSEEGKKITKAIEEVSRLRFREKIINAVILNRISYSRPLVLQDNLSHENKKGTLVHELCHRIISGQGKDLKFKNKITKENYDFEAHKVVDLILYDIWIALYGKKFADGQVQYEISIWPRKGISPYKLAWDWSLKMTKEQRAKEFKTYWL